MDSLCFSFRPFGILLKKMSLMMLNNSLELDICLRNLMQLLLSLFRSCKGLILWMPFDLLACAIHFIKSFPKL